MKKRAVDLMLRVVREGRPCKHCTYHTSSESGPFSINRFAIRWGQVRVVFDPYGHEATFHLYRDTDMDSLFRVVTKRMPGWGVLLREFARRHPSLWESGRLPNYGPIWHCYLPQRHRHSYLERDAIIHQAAE